MRKGVCVIGVFASILFSYIVFAVILGLEGITSVKSFANSQEVDKFIAKTILEKFRKGYIEQNIVSSPVASSSSPVPSLKKKSKNDAPIEIGNIFSHEFLDKFWDLSLEPSVKEVITADTVAETEATLGYKLPSAYIELMSSRNGGWPKNTVCSVMNDESQNRHIESFIGIGSSGDNLTHASRNWLDEWEYPKIGVYFGNCPSGGHDLIAMDYTECGPQGEPRIVQVDQEGDFEITFLANNIEEFIRKLRTEVYDDEEEVDGFQVVNSLENVPAKGAMSTSTKLFKSGGSSCSIS